MKIVNIIGGLGNQMFQYAFAISLKQKYPQEEVYIDTQHYRYAIVKSFLGNNFYHNGYEIDRIFPNAYLPIASPRDIARVSYYIPNYILSRLARRVFAIRKSELVQQYNKAYVFNQEALSNNIYSYYEGYWMAAKFFEHCRKDIIKVFEFPNFDTDENRRYANMLISNDSVSIHIRRGDYVKAPNFKDICTLSYYRRAIIEAKMHIPRPVFFIFSNDPKWCKENLMDVTDNAETHFITNNRGKESYRDMQLMSLARCNILANSSFSWWGAFLNKRCDQIVYVPSRWVNNISDKDVLMDDWIKI